MLADVATWFLGLALSAATGWVLVGTLTDRWRDLDRNACLQMACASVGIGLGLQSAARFFLMMLDFPGHRRHIWLDAALLLAALASSALIARWRRRQTSASATPAFPTPSAAPASRWLRWPVAWAMFASTVLVVCQCIRRLHGDHDAWSIWNVRARFFFRDPEHWRNAFIAAVHADYPLHMPLTTARLWDYAGSDSPWVPVSIAIGSWALTALMLMTALRSLRGAASSWLAMAAFVAWPLLGPLWSLQYADPIIAFYLLAAITLIAQASARGNHPGLLALAGLSAGCAAWTKNEGLPIALVLLVSVAALPLRRRPWRERAISSAAFLAGALPFLLTLAAMKTTVALHNDVMGKQDAASVMARLTDSERYLAIVKSLWWHVFNAPEWASSAEKLGIWSLPLLAATALALGRSRDPHLGFGSARASAALGGITAVFIAVYLLTPHNIYWHIATSVTRLLLQIWPSIVFAVFLTCRTPGESDDRRN